MCERRVARRRGTCEAEECEPNPKPRPKPNPSSADVAERGVASIGVRSSGNLCVEEDYVQGEAGAHSTTPTYTVRRDSPAREPKWSAFWLQKPSILRACVREEDAVGREAGAHSTTPTYTAGKDSRARVQHAEARKKVRPKSKNLQGKEAALTHTNGHTGRASTVL